MPYTVGTQDSHKITLACSRPLPTRQRPALHLQLYSLYCVYPDILPKRTHAMCALSPDCSLALRRPYYPCWRIAHAPSAYPAFRTPHRPTLHAVQP